MDQMLIVFGVLACAVGLFAWGRLRADIVAILVILALMVTRVLTPQEALAGFGNPLVMLIAAIFIVGEALVNPGSRTNWAKISRSAPVIRTGSAGRQSTILLASCKPAGVLDPQGPVASAERLLLINSTGFCLSMGTTTAVLKPPSSTAVTAIG
jgi:hypothetical protein